MKLSVFSDLHLEFSGFQPLISADAADVIVLAGDIWKKDHGIHWARATWPEHEIVYVAGNHEFYGSERKATLARLRAASQETGVHFLDNDHVIIQGVRFLGSTLWTDFRLYGAERQAECMFVGQERLNDFRVILEDEEPFTPSESVQLHQESVQWLKNMLKKQPFAGSTVVVTHHAPSWQSIVPQYQDDVLSACFASRLEHLMGRFELWIHGHTHSSLDYSVAGTRVVCNPRGYCPSQRPCENADFNPGLIVEVGNRDL